MSELIATTSGEIRSRNALLGFWWYRKFEVDKTIAEKDCEIEKLKNSLDTLLKAKTEQIIHEAIQKTLIYGEGFIRVEDAMKLIAELRHNKYKRCLAMALRCEDKINAIKNGYMVSSIKSRDGIMMTCPPECNPKFSFLL